MLWITSDLVEVNHRIEVSWSPYPFVHCLPVRLIGRGGMIIIRSDKGHNSGSDDLEVIGVSARDDLIVSRDDPPHQRLVLSARRFARASQHANVIDSVENDQVAHSWLGNHIMIETSQCIRSQAIGEQMVPTNPLIENSQLPQA